MGCGGAFTLGAARQQFPQAELVGGDLNAGLLKSGYAASLAMGLGITFRQEDACCVAEADNSVDVVISFAVYHEMPRSVSVQTIGEMFRILKPGGEMIISDPPPLRGVSPFEAVLLDWETDNRAEPYFTEMATADLGQMMRAAGFVDVSEGPLDDERPYPWVTSGVKPISN
jgi:SAM-dependent methyltransferase